MKASANVKYGVSVGTKHINNFYIVPRRESEEFLLLEETSRMVINVIFRALRHVSPFVM